MALPRSRRPRGTAEVVSAAVAVVAVLVLALRMRMAAAGALAQTWPALPALVLLVGAVGVWRLRQTSTQRRREAERVAALRITLVEFDAMDDRHFEHALRDLLVRDGCTARRVGGAGDQTADAIGDHPRLGRILAQAKHTRVGRKAGPSITYAVKDTARPVHKTTHALVITNRTFTRDAIARGNRHGTHPANPTHTGGHAVRWWQARYRL